MAIREEVSCKGSVVVELLRNLEHSPLWLIDSGRTQVSPEDASRHQLYDEQDALIGVIWWDGEPSAKRAALEAELQAERWHLLDRRSIIIVKQRGELEAWVYASSKPLFPTADATAAKVKLLDRRQRRRLVRKQWEARLRRLRRACELGWHKHGRPQHEFELSYQYE